MTHRRASEPAAATVEAPEEAAADDGGLQSPLAEEGDLLDDEVFDQREVTRRKKDKVKKLLLPIIRRLGELHVERKEKRKKRRAARPPPVPFPYAYDDPTAARGCFLFCSRPPPISEDVAVGENIDSGMKPSRSSYRGFVKSMLEKNDFYSKECNAHCDIRRPKALEDVG